MAKVSIKKFCKNSVKHQKLNGNRGPFCYKVHGEIKLNAKNQSPQNNFL
jgi:hypothetical protein